MRKPIVAGNWKMHKTVHEAVDLAQTIAQLVGQSLATCEVVLCPTYTSLGAVYGVIKDSGIGLGAQNMHSESEGAYTGDISPAMILTSGAEYVILGHSERRQYAFESDEMINRKTQAALATGLTPIVCVGEQLDQREAGLIEEVVIGQVRAALEDVKGDQAPSVVLAYEPVWAIGTGKTATAGQAEEVHALMRSFLTERFGSETADVIRIQYGGSVKPENAEELFSQENIDGGLIGGAALQADSFAAIVKAAK